MRALPALLAVALFALPFAALAAGAGIPDLGAAALGTVTAELPASAGALGLAVQGDRIGVDVTFPWILRTGVRVSRGALSVEQAGTYERWSLLRQITPPLEVQVKIGSAISALPPIVIEKEALQRFGESRR